jgi:hypothetical protein
LVIGDFNGDGIQDLVAVNYNSNNVSVLLGNGSGGFTPAAKSPFAVGNHPESVVVGDFNGDSKPDLATANFGAGGFTAATGSPFAASQPSSLVVGDLNVDGKQDLAVASEELTSPYDNTITVLLGAGTGSFSPATGSPFTAFVETHSVVVGDFNGDGIQDLATDVGGVLLGNGTGGFSEAAAIFYGPGGGLPVMADFNGDGLEDLALPESDHDYLFVLLGAGLPSDVSVSPASGIGASVTFTAVYSDPPGATDLSQVFLLVNNLVSDANGCYVRYVPQENQLSLASVSGAWMTPALTPGVAGTASNGLCTLNAGASSAGTAGNSLTLSVALTFSSGFVGSKNVYLYGIAFNGQNTGWVQEGTWTAGSSAGQPAIVSFSPNSGSGTSVTFTAVYTDPNGAGDMTEALLLVNSTVSTVNGCYVYYVPQSNLLYLSNDAGTGWLTPGLTPGAGGTGTSSNSQCTLHAGSSSAGTAGNNLTLGVTLSFAPAFVGAMNVYLYALGVSGQNSGWVTEGTWTPNPGAGPATSTTTGLASSATPSTYGQAITLTATVSPSAATGKVTFYDGVTVLGTSSLASGVATLTTRFVQAGAHTLRAYYAGGTGYLSSKSSPLPQNIDTVADVALRAPSTFPLTGAYQVAVGDFNGDGKADLAITEASGTMVNILLGNGDGTFQPAVPYGALGEAVAVAIADFNGDGKSDLAIGTVAGISVLLGNGNGTFQAAVSYEAGGAFTVADFNGDGIPDLATASVVLLGNGDGTFQPRAFYNGGGTSTFVIAGDFNGDGVADIAALTNTGISVTLGNGDGTFQSTVNAYNFSSGQSLDSIAIGDFNGDGKADLAVTGAGGGTHNGIEILLGNGDGSFNLSSNLTGLFWSVATGDFDGDGKIDLFVADNTNPIVTVFLGKGDGTFQPATTYPAAVAPTFLALGDFTGAGRTDVAMASLLDNSAGILLGSSVPIPQVSTTSLPGAQVGVSYSTTLAATSGVTPYQNWTVASGALPPGLALNPSTGAITGTPGNGIGSPYSFSVTVQDHNGNTSGPQALSITILGPPGIVSLSPNSGTGASVTFTAVYEDPYGAADLSQVFLLVNNLVSDANGCYVRYVPHGGQFSLASVGGAWMTPGGSGSVSNGLCTLYAELSSVSTAGNNLTLKIALGFSSAFVGSKNVYLDAEGFSGLNSGWAMEGTWTPNSSAGPPAIVSLSPNSGSGTSVTFTAVYSDPNGAGDLGEAMLLVNTGVSGPGACWIYYQPQSNLMYLSNDAGTGWLMPGLTPAVSGTVSNSQCTLNGGSSSAATAGNNLTLGVGLSFTPAFAGSKNV